MIPISLSVVINAAMARAAMYYILLKQQANQEVLFLGPIALPDGSCRAFRDGNK